MEKGPSRLTRFTAAAGLAACLGGCAAEPQTPQQKEGEARRDALFRNEFEPGCTAVGEAEMTLWGINGRLAGGEKVSEDEQRVATMERQAAEQRLKIVVLTRKDIEEMTGIGRERWFCGESLKDEGKWVPERR